MHQLCLSPTVPLVLGDVALFDALETQSLLLQSCIAHSLTQKLIEVDLFTLTAAIVIIVSTVPVSIGLGLLLIQVVILELLELS